ncbi:signal peptidase II [Agromyces sp. G08B096]|uniref:Lipoprotein signal peptidase n=1 Tax=Agromyces sp. G08B096 TaxID=3156399 RepID=A0AAU7WA97_9MICO
MTERVQHFTKAAPWIALAIAAAVLVADQLSKLWAEQELVEGERIPLLGDLFGLQLAYNPGAAFSMGSGSTWVFTVLAAVGVAVAAWFAWRTRSRAWAVCVGLLLGGATTHLLDRLFREPGFARGHVVDFLAYANWFIGNVADIALFAGALLLLVLSAMGLRLRPTDERPAHDPGTDAGASASTAPERHDDA